MMPSVALTLAVALAFNDEFLSRTLDAIVFATMDKLRVGVASCLDWSNYEHRYSKINNVSPINFVLAYIVSCLTHVSTFSGEPQTTADCAKGGSENRTLNSLRDRSDAIGAAPCRCLSTVNSGDNRGV
jgi:hypothetical protein